MKNNRFSESFAKADATFNGLYSVELKQLKGLSKDEISVIVPSADNLQVYQSCESVVEPDSCF
jgi:hypothetical protein